LIEHDDVLIKHDYENLNIKDWKIISSCLNHRRAKVANIVIKTIFIEKSLNLEDKLVNEFERKIWEEMKFH
jgi:hypothetical protein